MSLKRKQLALIIALSLSATSAHCARGDIEIDPDSEWFDETPVDRARPTPHPALPLPDGDFYFADHATTGNGANVAQVLDAAFDDLMASDELNELHKDELDRIGWRLGNLPQGQVGAMLEQLAGSRHADLGAATLNALKPLNSGLLTALHKLYADTDPAGRVWLQTAGNSSSLGGWQNSTGLKQRTQGLMVGADWSLGHAWRIGVLGAKTDTQLQAKPFSGELDSWHLGAYAVRQDGPLALRLGVIHSRHAGRNKRSVDLNLFNYQDQLRGNYTATSQQAFAELGYALNTSNLTIEPFVSLGYQRYHRDSFEEKGGYTALNVGAQTLENLNNTVGVRLSSLHALDNGISLKPHLGLSWKHLYGDTGSSVRQSFAWAKKPFAYNQFSINGTPLDRDTVALNVGLDLALSAQHSVGVAYSAEVGTDSRNQGLVGQWTLAF